MIIGGYRSSVVGDDHPGDGFHRVPHPFGMALRRVHPTVDLSPRSRADIKTIACISLGGISVCRGADRLNLQAFDMPVGADLIGHDPDDILGKVHNIHHGEAGV